MSLSSFAFTRDISINLVCAHVKVLPRIYYNARYDFFLAFLFFAPFLAAAVAAAARELCLYLFSSLRNEYTFIFHIQENRIPKATGGKSAKRCMKEAK